MTALKCVLWRRPRNTRRRQSGTMSLVHTTQYNNHKKSKQFFKQWYRYGTRKFLSRGVKPGNEREMPLLEPTVVPEVVPCSPEMPTLLPFTTEHEDPTSGIYQITSPHNDGQQFVRVLRGGRKGTYQPVVVLKRLPPPDGDPQQEDAELRELHRGDELSSPLGGYVRDEEDWLQWPEEYEGCSGEDIVDFSPVSSFPEIDVIDGVEFFSFLQEEDMNNYSRLHSRSWFFEDSFTPPQEERALSPDDFVEDKLGGLIVPTKTKDITQIKGWKRKLFAEDCCEDFKCASWIKKKEEELVVPEEKPPVCSAFTSSSLEDFLKTSSQLRISYLTSYIPNVTPIPSDSPILSLGTLTKDKISTLPTRKDVTVTVQKTVTVSPESRPKDLSLVSQPKNEASALERNVACIKRVSVSSPSLLDDASTLSSSKDSTVVQSFVDAQLEQNHSGIATPCGQILFDDENCHPSVIREPILDSQDEQKKYSDFLSELRQPNVYNMARSRYEQVTKTNMHFPIITEKMAHTATWALNGSADNVPRMEKIQEPILGKVGRCNATMVQEGEKTPEKRNKRMIRLPARFLDSAVILPGCEDWVAPQGSELPNSRKRRRKSDVVPHGDTLRSRSNTNKRLEDVKTDEIMASAKSNNCQMSADFLKSNPSTHDMLQLKHLKDHSVAGESVVRSLLIVHQSLRVRDAVAQSISLPLAGIALPIDSSQRFDGLDPQVYLLYGAKEALLQNYWSAQQSSYLDKLLQSGSPVAPILRNITSGLFLDKNPLCIMAVLESRVQTLLVYLASSHKDGKVVPNSRTSATTETVLSEKSNGNLESGEISSLQVSRSKITVKPSFAGETIRKKSVSCEDSTNSLCPDGGAIDVDPEALIKARKAEAMAASRKDCRRQMRRLYNTLLSECSEESEKYETLSGIRILQKAKEHIFSLCSRAKELKEEKRRLRMAHNRLVESYTTCLETLPADAQKKSLDSLSRQIDVPTTKPNCLQPAEAEKKRTDDTEMQKVAKAAWGLVGPCSVQRVELRNGHTVYVYSSHEEEKAQEKDKEDVIDVADKEDVMDVVDKEDVIDVVDIEDVIDVVDIEDDDDDEVQEVETTPTSMWVSDVGEPCFVTRLLSEDEDENR